VVRAHLPRSLKAGFAGPCDEYLTRTPVLRNFCGEEADGSGAEDCDEVAGLYVRAFDRVERTGGGRDERPLL
jgi:hypothetical protein